MLSLYGKFSQIWGKIALVGEHLQQAWKFLWEYCFNVNFFVEMLYFVMFCINESVDHWDKLLYGDVEDLSNATWYVL